MNALQVADWGNPGRTLHGFGTRNGPLGGTSRADWRGKSVSAGGREIPIVSLRQVHGDTILVFQGRTGETEALWGREGDALITSAPGFALAVFTADCLPILLFAPEKNVAAAIHAGWRGTAREIAGKTVHKMGMAFGSDPSRIRALLGPCIGPCCYEVDRPVEESFRSIHLPWESFASARGRGKWLLNLQEANIHLLIKSGVKKENIRKVAYCTACRPDLFFSHRREKGAAGRHLNYISLLAS